VNRIKSKLIHDLLKPSVDVTTDIKIRPTYGVSYVSSKSKFGGQKYLDNPLCNNISIEQYNELCAKFASKVKKILFPAKSCKAASSNSKTSKGFYNTAAIKNADNSEGVSNIRNSAVKPPKRSQSILRIRKYVPLKVKEYSPGGRRYKKLPPPPLGLTLGYGIFNIN